MKQATELYWSQHKVFFLATLALFPDKLNGHEVNQLFYFPYFAGNNEDFIEIELEDYQKAGYLKYEKPAALYKIVSVNTEQAAKDLTQYLKRWQQNELRTLSARKAPDLAHQQQMLLKAILHARANHQSEPRITLEDVYGKLGSYAYEPPFWELALAIQLLAGKVEIQDLGYNQRQGGLYGNNPQPFVEFKIVARDILDMIEHQISPEDKSAEPTGHKIARLEREPSSRDANVFMQGRLVSISIAGDKTYTIAKLGEDASHYKFMRHLLSPENNDIDITINEINRLDDLKAARSLSELARYCGFSKKFKKAFFKTSTEKKIHFKTNAQLNNYQVEAIRAQASKLEDMES